MIPWFERKFNFDFDVGHYPELIERLRGTPARLEDRIRSLPTKMLTRAEGDVWSIQENAGHLLDLEDLFVGRFEDFQAGCETLRPADLTNQKTENAGHNNKPVESILSAFRKKRMKLAEELERLSPSGFAKTALHPRLKVPMRLVDSMLVQAEHDDFHLGRITEQVRRYGRSNRRDSE